MREKETVSQKERYRKTDRLKRMTKNFFVATKLLSREPTRQHPSGWVKGGGGGVYAGTSHGRGLTAFCKRVNGEFKVTHADRKTDIRYEHV